MTEVLSPNLAAGGTLPAGVFLLEEDLTLYGVLRGAGAHWGNDSTGATSILCSPGKRITIAAGGGLEGLTIRWRGTDTTPPGSELIPSRIAGVPDFQGSGVLVLSRCHISNVRVTRSPGVGISVIADAMGIQGNANHCIFHDVKVDACVGHGFFIDGSNANAGVFTKLDAVSCGGWGIRDESLLGNTYSAPHTSANAGGGYSILRGTVIGPYAEVGQPANEMGDGCTVIGGIGAGWEGMGVRLSARHTSTLQVQDGDETFSFGNNGRLFQVDGPDHKHHAQVKDDGVRFYVGNISQESMRWTSRNARGFGMMRFPAVMVGDRKIVSLDSYGIVPEGWYLPGDMVLTDTGAHTVTASCGVGPAYDAARTYRTGNIADISGTAYVVTDSPMNGALSNVAPDIDLTDTKLKWAVAGPAVTLP